MTSMPLIHPQSQRRLPWAVLAASVVAIAALAHTSDQWMLLTLVVTLLVISEFTSLRLPSGRSVPLTLRAFVFTLAVILVGVPDTGLYGWYLRPEYTNLAGILLAIELVIRAWEPRGSRSDGEFRGTHLLISGLIVAAASDTFIPTAIQILVPLYVACVTLAARSFFPRSRSLASLHFLRGVWVAIGLSLGLGLMVIAVKIDPQVQLLFADWMRRDLHNSQIGLNLTPTLGETFNPEASTRRVLRMDGPTNERHLRVLTYGLIRTGAWGPAAQERRFAPLREPKIIPAGDHLQVELYGDTFDCLPAPLNVAMVTCETPIMVDPAGDLQTHDSASPVRYEMVVSPDEHFHGPANPSAQDPTARDRDISIPDTLDPRVWEEARRIAGDGPPLLRITRIAQELSSTHQYSLTFQPGPGDALSDFILNHRAAHCEYFASAMVVMSRIVGVPARLATGFYATEKDGPDRMIVRDRDAHAWAECWVEGTGWMTMDATPASGRPDALYPPITRLQHIWETLSDLPGLIGQWLGNLSPTYVAGVSLVLAGGALAWNLLRGARKRNAAEMPYAPIDPRLAAIAARFEKWVQRRRKPESGRLTWREQALSTSAVDDSLRFVDEYQKVRFGGRNDEAHLQRLREIISELELRKT